MFMTLLSRLLGRLDGWAKAGAAPALPAPGNAAVPAVPVPRSEAAPYDDALLERARNQWQFGDWDDLVKLGRENLEHHPQRAKLALLAAAGHLQLGNAAAARELVRLAREWKADKRLISQILAAGVHNTLGRAAAAIGQEQRARLHFDASIATAMPQADVRLLGQTRTVRETARLGLLPQAARLVGEELDALRQARGGVEPRMRMLETELSLMQHELAIALSRQQIYPAASPGETAQGSPAWLEALARKSVSQLGQDLWVLEKTGYKRDGYFVEFGATDGVLLSNSWLLETQFGWQGLCAEPNPKFFERLEKNRRCIVTSQYISDATGRQVEIILADAYTGSRQYADDDHFGAVRAAYQQTGHVLTVTTVSLEDFLLQHDAPRRIDYLSIDTEGSEFEILQAFPFDQWDIRLLTVEHNHTHRRADIRALLEGHGYRCTEAEWDDWYEKTV
ncbi:FkbM family methyltransferase [Solidesulfovibrio sp.]